MNLQPPVLETGALPIELLPWVAGAVYSRPFGIALHGYSPRVARPSPRQRALGTLFLLLALAFAGVAYGAGVAHTDSAARWVVAVAAGLLAAWLLGLAVRAFRHV